MANRTTNAGSGGDDDNTPPPHIMAAITMAVELSRSRLKEELPDVREIARSVVLEIFNELDIDLKDRTQVMAFRNNNAAVTRWRDTQGKLWTHGLSVLVGVLVVSGLMLLGSKMFQPNYPVLPPTIVNPSTGRP